MQTTETTTLAEFLLARVAEDEAVARAAKVMLDDHGGFGADGERGWHDADGLCNDEYEHIERFAPGRILADIAAKRRIVEMHTGVHECVSFRRGDTTLAPYEDDDEPSYRRPTVYVCEGYVHHDDPTLRLLALPYADHPDFREEWR